MQNYLNINQLIEIELEDDQEYSGRYRTRIEEIKESAIHVGMPIKEGFLVPLRPDAIVIIWIWKNSASYALYCKVLERKFKPIPILILSTPFKVKKVQRRNFVRVPVNIEVEYAIINNSSEKKIYKTRIKDLSGGGTQFRSKNNLKKGDVLDLKIYLSSEEIVAKAKVVWVYDEIINEIISYIIGVEFYEMPERVRDKIIKFVFAKQRELINKGVL